MGVKKRTNGNISESSNWGSGVVRRWNDYVVGLLNVFDDKVAHVMCLGQGIMQSESHDKWFGEDRKDDKSPVYDKMGRGVCSCLKNMIQGRFHKKVNSTKLACTLFLLWQEQKMGDFQRCSECNPIFPQN